MTATGIVMALCGAGMLVSRNSDDQVNAGRSANPVPFVDDSVGPSDNTTRGVGASLTLATASQREKLAAHAAMMDPRRDGWQSESVAEQVNGQLKRLAGLLTDLASIPGEAVADLVADGFSGSALVPEHLTSVYRDDILEVSKAVSDSPDDLPHHGPSGLAGALDALASSFQPGPPTRVKFKLFRVDPSPGHLSTISYYEALGVTATARVQQSATWHCRWTLPDDVQEVPRLARIEVRNFEMTRSHATGAPLWSDATATVLRGCESFRSQLQFGIDHWASRIPRRFNINIFGHHGIALGDVNGDGLDDVYICQPGGLPNCLFVQTGDGSAEDISAEAGVDVLDYSSAALFVDLDNDGDQDLVVSTLQGLFVLANDGAAHFAVTAEFSMPQWTSLSAADYDQDGDLDLYLAVYRGASEDHWEYAFPVPYHDANNGGANVLLENGGAWQFEDVTQRAGLNVNNRRYSFAAAWEDYDNDGDLDLYVANDFGRNNLYRNDGSRFLDVASSMGVEDTASGMSVTWGDYDRDGRMDVYVSNMFSAAGNRVAFQRTFQEQATANTKASLQRLARGNSLFQNVESGPFRDVSESAGVTMGRWAWASQFVDINNNGWEDLLVTNGMITTEDTGDL